MLGVWALPPSPDPRQRVLARCGTRVPSQPVWRRVLPPPASVSAEPRKAVCALTATAQRHAGLPRRCRVAGVLHAMVAALARLKASGAFQGATCTTGSRLCHCHLSRVECLCVSRTTCTLALGLSALPQMEAPVQILPFPLSMELDNSSLTRSPSRRIPSARRQLISSRKWPGNGKKEGAASNKSVIRPIPQRSRKSDNSSFVHFLVSALPNKIVAPLFAPAHLVLTSRLGRNALPG